METFYVLSGNRVLGHFDTLRESWTLEEAVEMANICTTQSGLELCELIRNSCEWDPADTCILCDLAGLNDEWLNDARQPKSWGVLSYEYS